MPIARCGWTVWANLGGPNQLGFPAQRPGRRHSVIKLTSQVQKSLQLDSVSERIAFRLSAGLGERQLPGQLTHRRFLVSFARDRKSEGASAMGCVCGIRVRLWLAMTAVGLLAISWSPAICQADDPAPAGHLTAAGEVGSDAVLFLDRDPLQLTTITGEVFAFSFSADDKILATCGGGRWDNQNPGFVRVWDLSSGQEIVSYQSPRGVGTIALSNDGRRLAWSSWNRETVLRRSMAPSSCAEKQ